MKFNKKEQEHTVKVTETTSFKNLREVLGLPDNMKSFKLSIGTHKIQLNPEQHKFGGYDVYEVVVSYEYDGSDLEGNKKQLLLEENEKDIPSSVLAKLPLVITYEQAKSTKKYMKRNKPIVYEEYMNSIQRQDFQLASEIIKHCFNSYLKDHEGVKYEV